MNAATAPGAYIDEIDSVSGDTFETLIEIEPDGTVTVATPYRSGYGSVHIRAVHDYTGRPCTRVMQEKYRTLRGAVRVMSIWN